MKINRVWAMPNKNTFTIKPIAELLDRVVLSHGGIIVDPFAATSKIATITNDLNPEYDTTYHLDALDFLKMIPDESCDCVLYDPPYSVRQVAEVYKRFGMEITQETTRCSWRKKHLEQIRRILKPNGIVVCCGWSSNGVGKKYGFEMEEVLLVPHGGMHNDTIVTVERKVSTI